jgi:hypothetical protein
MDPQLRIAAGVASSGGAARRAVAHATGGGERVIAILAALRVPPLVLLVPPLVLLVPPLVLLVRQYLPPRTGPAGKLSRASFAAASAARPK